MTGPVRRAWRFLARGLDELVNDAEPREPWPEDETPPPACFVAFAALAVVAGIAATLWRR